MARIGEMLLGHSEAALRAPALVLGIASVFVMYFLARLFLVPTGALVATLLLAFSPPHVAWSVEARGYSALILFTMLSSYFFLQLLREMRPVWLSLFIMSSICAAYVHLYGVLVVATQFGLVLGMTWLGRSRDEPQRTPSVRTFILAFALIGFTLAILYGPALRSIATDGLSRGNSPFNPWLPWLVVRELSGLPPPPVIGLSLATAVVGWLSIRQKQPAFSSYVAALLVGPLGLMMILRPADLYPRFFAYWLPFFLILIAAGLTNPLALAKRWPRVSRAYLPAAAGGLVVLTVNWYGLRHSLVTDEGFRQAAQKLVQGAAPATTFCSIGGSRSVWRYYLPEPIATPLSLSELHDLLDTHDDVRCAYYEATWQDADQGEIASFLFTHASWTQVVTRFPDVDEQTVLTSFVYQAPS